MAQNRRTIFRRSGAVTSAGTADQQTVTLGDKREAWFLLAIRFKLSAGSGANYQLRVRTNSGGVNGDIDEIYTGAAAVAVATATNDVADQPIPFDTDTDGKVYFKTGFNAGADNNYDFVLWFEKAVGS